MRLDDLAEIAKQLTNDAFVRRFTGAFLLEEGRPGGRNAREVFELSEAVVRVGRNPLVQIPLLRAAISVRHAELRWNAPTAGGDGGWRLVDLGSTNGSFVDGQRLCPGVAQSVVVNLSVVSFGPVPFSFLTPQSMLGVLRRLEAMSAEFGPAEFSDLRESEGVKTLVGQPQGMNVGDLRDDSLRRLLKDLDRDQRSGTVLVVDTKHKGEGRLTFRTGRLVDASTSTGLQGIEAVKALLRLGAGRYVYDPTPPEGALSTPLSAILYGLEEQRSIAALALSEAQLRATVENAFHGIVACDDQGKLLSLNSRAEQMLARQFDPRTRLSEILRSTNGEDVTGLLLSPVGEGRLHEVVGVRSGEPFPIEVAVTRVEVAEQPRTWSLALQDLSERKRAEAALRESQVVLQQAQKMDAVGRLAAGITHDFNNLLSVINGYTELVRDELTGQNRERLDTVLDAGRQAAELTSTLLTFCRRKELNPEPQAINEVIEGLVGVLGGLLGSGVELLVHAGKNLAEVRVDKVQLEQILMNLIVNAREAMPRGGEIHVATANVVVSELAEVAPGDYVRLTVSDTGTGISPDVLGNVFEPFFTTKATGTGLGLATVYGVVRQSGGYVKVESEVGIGTTFSVYLPRHTSSQRIELSGDQDDDSVGTETQISRWQNVLVVEDQAGVLGFVTEVLSSKGYLVLSAVDGAEGLELYEDYRERIDLVLTDVVMPRLSGTELVKRIRELDSGQRVLFMSTAADVELEGQPFLPKPFSAETLLAAVDGALDALVE